MKLHHDYSFGEKKSVKMEVAKYFERLELDLENFKEANFENLVKLSTVHKCKIPFENLDTFTSVKSKMEL